MTMTAKEFIETYTWSRAKEMQAEMLAKSSRKPKEWTFVEESDKGVRKDTLYFDKGCPFKLKSSGMIDWLRAFLLWAEADETESSNGFSACEQLEIGIESILAQLNGYFWVFDPSAFPQSLYQWILKAEAEDESFDEGEDIIAALRDLMGNKFETENLSERVYWDCYVAILLCSVYFLHFFIKTGNVTEQTVAAMSQLRSSLNQAIDEGKENGEEPYFPVQIPIFEHLIKEMIPQFELSGNEEVIHWSYEFAGDYYQATRRFSLAEKFRAKLNS